MPYRKVKSSGFWLCPITGFHSKTKQDGYEYWPSKLEYRVWCFLNHHGLKPIKQFPLLLLPATEYTPNQYWKVDFCLPSHGLLIEVKGSWINNKGNTIDRRLLRYNYALASRTPFKVIFLSDENFTIGNIPVTNYKDKNKWLLQQKPKT